MVTGIRQQLKTGNQELVKQEMHRVPKEQQMWIVRWKLRCSRGTLACTGR